MSENTAALTTTETARFAELETTIATDLEKFMEVGNALLEIRDRQYYREKFRTFEKYCYTRWSISRPRAYQLMEAAEVVKQDLSTNVDKPKTEAQVRPLKKLPKEKRSEAWDKACKASEGQPTAQDVQAAVSEITEPPHVQNGDDEKAAAVLEQFQADQEAEKAKLREMERREHTPVDTPKPYNFGEDIRAVEMILNQCWQKCPTAACKKRWLEALEFMRKVAKGWEPV